MGRLMGGLLAVAVLVFPAGCKGPASSAHGEKTLFRLMQEKAAAITGAGGLAALGIGQSATVSVALDNAKTRARTELAHILESRFAALKKDFVAEVGEDHAADYEALFSAAIKNANVAYICNDLPKDLKFVTEQDQTTAWALMVKDPKLIADAFAREADTQHPLYARFFASHAFKELDRQIREYAVFKKKDDAVHR